MENRIDPDCIMGLCSSNGSRGITVDNDDDDAWDDTKSVVSFAIVAWSLMQLVWVGTALRPPKRCGVCWTYTIAFVTPIVTEAPLLLMAIKLWCMRDAVGSNTSDPRADVVLCIDLAIITGLAYAIYLNYKSKNIAEAETKEFESYGPKLPQSWSWGFWIRMIWPLFAPLGMKTVRDVVYATPEEVEEAGPKGASYLKLDIYKPRDATEGEMRPVLMYIHGGIWMFGDKIVPNPLYGHFASHGWIVVTVNYRLSPAYPFPTHLIDCKRAIRWIKQNINSHGGDPDFVCVSGDSAGSHMAELLALTPNEPIYQPGFEEVLTDIRACAAINGVHDLTNKHGVLCEGTKTPDWFARDICGLGSGYEDPKTRALIMSYSPECLVEQWGITQNGSGVARVPFLVFHGESDNVVDVRHTREFVKTYKKLWPDTKITYIEYPGGHHGYYNVNSVRTFCQMIAMTRFLNRVHRDYIDEGVCLGNSEHAELGARACLSNIPRS